MQNKIKAYIINLSIKRKFILAIAIILITSIPLISIVFINQSHNLLIDAMENKVRLLNRNFSIVSKNAIMDSSFSFLQELIKEVAEKDRELKALVVCDGANTILASSDSQRHQIFSKFEGKDVQDILQKNADIILRDAKKDLLYGISYIYRDAMPVPLEQEQPRKDEQQKEKSSEGDKKEKDSAPKKEKIGFVYVSLTTEFLSRKVVTLWLFSGIFTIVLLGLGIAGAYRLGSLFTNPILGLATKVRNIASGDLNVSIRSNSKDEIGSLIDDVETMRVSIKDLTENLEAKVQERTVQLKEANQKLFTAMDELWGEMQLAKKIQQVLLPKKPLIQGFDISAHLKPADQVGGDYYDIINVKGIDWIIIGDVSGHGVPAGLVMMMVQTAIHTILSERADLTPAQLLSIVNKTITENIRNLGESKYMTIVAMAALGNNTMSFSGLHRDIFVYRTREKRVDIIPTRGMWIGLENDITDMLYLDQFNIDINDVILLYTDGITEATGNDGLMFGPERLEEIMIQYGDSPVDIIKEKILTALEPFQQDDDITLLVMRRLM